jgi:hypothetical protein
MPTREQVEAELARLPPEQHAAFLAEVERRMQGAITHPGAPAEAATPSEAAPDARPAFNRFISGAASTALPSMDTLGDLVGAATDTPMGVPMPVLEVGEDGKIHIRPSKSISLGLDTLKGMFDSHKEQFVKAGSSAKRAAELGAEGDIGGAARQAAATVGYTSAGLVPLIGPPAAHAGEAIASGDVAGGLGEAAGLATALLPFGKEFAGGIETRAIKRLESGAGKNLAKVVGARWQEVPDVMANTRTIAEGLGVGNREKLLDKVKGEGSLSKQAGKHDPASLLGGSETRLKSIKDANADVPIDLVPAAQGVRNSTEKLKSPLKGPVSLDPEMVSATEDWANRIDEVALSHGTPPGPPSAVFGYPTMKADVPPGSPVFNPATMQVDTLKGLSISSPQTGTLAGAPATPGSVPASEVFKMRTQAGDVGARKGGFKANPLTEVSASGKAAASVYGELRSILHEAIPGLSKADLDYSTWRKVGDLLQASTQKGALKGAPALELLGLKLPISGALGQLTMGAGLGAGAGAVAGSAGTGAMLGGAYGAFQVAKEIANSAYWQSLSAATKIKVANAIKSGALTTAEVGARAGGVTVPAVSRYGEPQPPEEQQ